MQIYKYVVAKNMIIIRNHKTSGAENKATGNRHFLAYRCTENYYLCCLR
jgi:hypothetical protein